MRGKAHLACGLIAGAGVSFLGNFSFFESLLIASSSALFSLIPDIDHPDSMLGHLIKPVSKFIKDHIGHRTITHSGLWMALYIFLCVHFYNTFYFPLIFGATIGFFSHILSDSLTAGGTPWFWPLKRRRYGFTKIKTGEKDGLLVVMADIILLGLYYLIWNCGIPYLSQFLNR